MPSPVGRTAPTAAAACQASTPSPCAVRDYSTPISAIRGPTGGASARAGGRAGSSAPLPRESNRWVPRARAPPAGPACARRNPGPRCPCAARRRALRCRGQSLAHAPTCADEVAVPWLGGRVIRRPARLLCHWRLFSEDCQDIAPHGPTKPQCEITIGSTPAHPHAIAPLSTVVKKTWSRPVTRGRVVPRGRNGSGGCAPPCRSQNWA